MENNLEWIIWHITNKCNLNCTYCFTKSSSSGSPDELQKKDILRVVDKIGNSEASLVTLIGGEPLTLSFLPEVIERLTDYNKKVNLDTNGILLKEKWSPSYLKLNRIHLSLDSIDENEHNSQRGDHNKVIDSIEFLSKQPVNFGSIITVTSRNVKSLEDTGQFLIDNDAETISFNRMRYTGRGEKDCAKINNKEENMAVEQILRLKNKSPQTKMTTSGFYNKKLFYNGLIDKLPFCMCGDVKVTINYDGNVYPCEVMPFLLPKEQLGSLFRTKNILKNDLGDILNDSETERWKKIVYEKPDECSSCEFTLYCDGGCKTINLVRSGRNSKDHYCHLNDD